MSFSNNSSRTTLKDDAYGTRLTLSETLRVPTIYLNGSNLSTQLTTIKTTTPSTLSATCTGTDLELTNKLKCKALDIVGTADNYTYMDMRNTYGNSDYDARIAVDGGNPETKGKGRLEFVADSCEIDAPFTATHLNGNVVTIGENDTNGFSYIDMLTKFTATPFSVRLECTDDADDIVKGLGTLTVTSNKNTFSGLTTVNNLFKANSLQINGTSSNTYLGYNSGLVTTTGNKNSCFGHGSGELITTGHSNTCIGHSAGNNIVDGEYNTCVGYKAGVVISNDITADPTSGIYIGSLAQPTQYATNETVIGFAASGNGSNTVTIGNDSVSSTYLKGSSVHCTKVVGVNMEVSGDISCEGTITMDTAQITTANIASLSVTGNCSLNSIVLNEIKTPIINQSTYITFHGTSYVSGTFTVTNYEGTTQNFFYSLDDIRYSIPQNCISLQIVYSYYTDITNNHYQGLKKFYYLKDYNGDWIQHVTEAVGSSNNYMPSITVTSTGNMILKPPEITLSGTVTWCFSIWFY